MGKIYQTERELRFGDCDVSGTAYFPSYLSILNGVNEEFWGHNGYPWHRIMTKERWGTPTVHLSCDFSKPSFFGETLVYDLAVTRIGDSSVTFRHRIRCGRELRWTSTQVLVASDLNRHRSMKWPADVREMLQAWLVEDADLDF